MTVIGEAESGHKHYGQAEGGKTTKATGQSISGNGSLGSLGSFDPWFLSSDPKNSQNKNTIREATVITNKVVPMVITTWPIENSGTSKEHTSQSDTFRSQYCFHLLIGQSLSSDCLSFFCFIWMKTAALTNTSANNICEITTRETSTIHINANVTWTQDINTQSHLDTE